MLFFSSSGVCAFYASGESAPPPFRGKKKKTQGKKIVYPGRRSLRRGGSRGESLFRPSLRGPLRWRAAFAPFPSPCRESADAKQLDRVTLLAWSAMRKEETGSRKGRFGAAPFFFSSGKKEETTKGNAGSGAVVSVLTVCASFFPFWCLSLRGSFFTLCFLLCHTLWSSCVISQ